MVREYLRQVHVLRGVYKKAPPDDIEPYEEYSRPETGFVVCVEEGGRQSAEKYHRDDAAAGADQHEPPPAEAVNE